MVSGMLVFSSCGKQISSFVGSKNKAALPAATPETPPVSTNKGIKLSPGAGLAAGNQVQARMSLTPTQQTIKGSQVEAKITISQSRNN